MNRETFFSKRQLRILFLPILVIMLGVLAVVFYDKTESITAYEVVLGPNGFVPQNIQIEKGGTVMFTSETEEPFWPASDNHPSHSEDPDFDPKQPIDAHLSWSFTFDSQGTYSFHDHLKPNFRGTITVTDDGNNVTSNNVSTAVSAQDCVAVDFGSNKVDCWNDAVLTSLKRNGISAAFQTLKEAYSIDPAFVAGGCHGTVHRIGEEAYDLYYDGETVELSEDTKACGYGFYHGFLTRLLHENPSLSNARDFCRNLTIEGEPSERLQTTCFHGIGHGMIEEEPLPEYYWGSIERLLLPAIETCKQVSDIEDEVGQCIDGTFSALILFMANARYGFSYNKEAPFEWCEQFSNDPTSYRMCIFESSQDFGIRVVEYDIGKMWAYIRHLEEQFQELAVRTGVAAMMQRDILRDDNSDYFTRCRILPRESLTKNCLNGVLIGFFAHGDPGNEAAKAEAFCKENVVATSEERQWCFGYLSARID